jgi:anti-anti-sigma factor
MISFTCAEKLLSIFKIIGSNTILTNKFDTGFPVIINGMLINSVAMEFKRDTKEKFHVITLPGPALSATMTEEITVYLLSHLQNDVKNVVLVLKDINSIDNAAAEALVNVQQKFYENNVSFVICELQKPVEKFLDENELLEIMNVTPTQSEAFDIVQMEEIEREMMDEGNQ